MFGQILPFSLTNRSGQSCCTYQNYGDQVCCLIHSLGTATSPDGVHWSANVSVAAQVSAGGDANNQVFFDERLNQYVGTVLGCLVCLHAHTVALENGIEPHAFATREALPCMRSNGMPHGVDMSLTGLPCKCRPNTEGITRIDAGAMGLREAAITTSADFQSWSPAQEIFKSNVTEFHPPAGGGQNYTAKEENLFVAWAYPNTTSFYIGLPTFGELPRAEWGRFTTELAISTDLHSWQRISPGQRFIPAGMLL
jgi:hypothetical protein